MRSHSLRTLAYLFLALAMLLSLFAGCQKQETPDPAQAQALTGKVKTPQSGEKTEDPEPSQPQDPPQGVQGQLQLTRQGLVLRRLPGVGIQGLRCGLLPGFVHVLFMQIHQIHLILSGDSITRFDKNSSFI